MVSRFVMVTGFLGNICSRYRAGGGKGHDKAQRAVDEVAERHRRDGAANRESRDDGEGESHGLTTDGHR